MPSLRDVSVEDRAERVKREESRILEERREEKIIIKRKRDLEVQATLLSSAKCNISALKRGHYRFYS